MITDQRIKEFIQLLDEATRDGDLQWEPTAEEGGYRAAVARGIIRLQPEGEAPEGLLVAAEVLNDEHFLVFRCAPRSGELLSLLQRLYAGARECALQPDQVLSDIVEDLKDRMRRKQA